MGVQSLGQEDPLEEDMATHSGIPAWRIPWTEEPGGLPWGRKESDMTEVTQHAHRHSNIYLTSTLCQALFVLDAEDTSDKMV